MKKLFQIIVFAMLIMSLAISGIAQKPKSKDDYFKEIQNLFKTKTPEDLEKAYFLAKEFLAAYPNEKGDNINKLKQFVKQNREPQFFIDLEKGKYSQAFAEGKEILAETPDNVAIVMNLAYGGFDALSKKQDSSFADLSVEYAKQTLKLIEAGKVPTNFAPFKDKDDTSAWMYYIIGNFLKAKDVRESAINFYRSTKFESQIKNNSYPYYVVAVYYEEIYQKLATEYNAKIKTMNDDESKKELDKVNKVIDLMLDAYARAIKLAETENIPEKTTWRNRFTDVYKFRNKSDAGLNEYITLKNASPMPDPSAL